MDREVIRNEVIRCCETYGMYPSFIFFGYGLLPMSACGSLEEVWMPTGMVIEEFMDYALAHSAEIRARRNRQAV